MADHYGITDAALKAFDWVTTENGQIIAAGALGGVVRAATLRNTWREAAITVAVGLVCAKYLSPLPVLILSPFFAGLNTAAAPPTSIAFLTGLLGVGLAGYLIDFLKIKRNGGAP